MNPKHLACVLVAFAMGLMFWVTMNARSKMAAMASEASLAETAKMNAAAKRQTMEIKLSQLKKETEPVRSYLERWRPFLVQTDTLEKAELLINEKIKAGGLLVWDQKNQVVPGREGSYVGKILRARVTFIDDYARCLQWMGAVEETIPTARVSTCKLTKGQEDNDLKMELVVDLPLASNEDGKEKKAS